ncbi:MAG: NAD-dependent epimerase/dehydratase family protein [Kiritimatiellales bacterium]|nr:NAD-dependent epimerase/dehydratase family protein [Kiritimatiellales bacterium]
MRILIIGGTGLISTYITEVLAGQGEEVVLYNRGQTSGPAHPGVTTLHGDRTDYAAFDSQMNEAGRFDVVIDMVGFRPEDAESVVRTFSGKTSQFVFCSTVDVYAKPASCYPYTEAEGYGGLNEYSCNKVVIEKRLRQAAEAGAFPLTIIRPAYTYGEGRSPLHPVSARRYLDRVLKGKPVVVHGDGQSLWTCSHASDVARAFAAACGNQTAHNQAYHVTGEEWMTWNQYHQQVAEALGVSCPELVHIPSCILSRFGITSCSENFQFNNIFDNSKAKRDLGYQYTVTWKEGVRRMEQWLNEHPEHRADSDTDDREDLIIAAWKSRIEGL